MAPHPAHLRPPPPARPAPAGGGARAFDVPDRARGGGPVRPARGGAAPLRMRASISARRPTPCAGARCERQGRHHRRGRSRWPALPDRACRKSRRGLAVAADEEALPFARRLARSRRLGAGAAVRQRSAGHAVQIRRALKPDGLLLAALAGGDTLTELRQAFAAAEAEIEGGVSPRVAPFADVRDLGALLQRAGFALPVTDVDRAHRALRVADRADARSAPHGRDQCADRAPPAAAQARDACGG